jgi:hypothetical protein
MEKDVQASEPQVVITEVTNPEDVARFHRIEEQGRANSEWLQTHWADVLPAARGKFLAVAGQQAFIADTALEATALARAAHPDDEGVLVQYVRTTRGPRIYATQWGVARL